MPDQPIRRALPWWAGVHALPALAAGVLALGVALGAGAAWVQPRPWSSSSSVLVGVPVTGSQDQTVRASQLVNMDTEVQVALSREVLDAAATSLGAPAGALVGDVTATVPAGTQVIEVTAEATTGVTAQRRAAAVTQAYLDLRAAEAADQLLTEQESAQARVESLTDQLRTARSEQGQTAEDSTERLLLDAQVDALTTVLTDERARLYGVEGSAPTPGNVLGAATQPVRGGLAPVLLVGAGTLGGLVGGLLLTWLVLVLAQTVRSAPQLGSLGVPSRRLGAGADPVQLARPAVLRQRVVDGAVLRVAQVGTGAAPDLVRTRVEAGLRLPEDVAGSVVAVPSPLAGTRAAAAPGDLFVLLATRGTPMGDVEQAVEVVSQVGAEVVGVLLIDDAAQAVASDPVSRVRHRPGATAEGEDPPEGRAPADGESDPDGESVQLVAGASAGVAAGHDDDHDHHGTADVPERVRPSGVRPSGVRASGVRSTQPPPRGGKRFLAADFSGRKM